MLMRDDADKIDQMTYLWHFLGAPIDCQIGFGVVRDAKQSGPAERLSECGYSHRDRPELHDPVRP